MESAAQLALRAEQVQAFALSMFSVIQLAMSFVAILLAQFMIRRSRSAEMGRRMSPIHFMVLSGAVLGLGAFFTLYWGVQNALFAFAFAIGLVLSTLDAVVAVSFLLANTLLRPWEMSGSAEMSFIPKVLGALALLSWVFYGVRGKRLSLLLNWPSRFFIAFTFWVLLSAVTSAEFMQGYSDFANTMQVAAILFVLVANVPDSDKDLRLLEKVFVVSITGVIAHAFCMTMSQWGWDPSQHRIEGAGMTGNSNDLAALAVQALPISVIPLLMAVKKKWDLKLIAWLAFPMLLLGLWLAQSRGATLACGLSALTYFAIRARNPKKAALIVAVCLPLLVGLYSVMSLVRNADDLQGSSESRMSFLIAGIRMAIHNPIMGVGFQNFPRLYESYAAGPMTYEWGERTAHNTWILGLAETGFPGFLFLIGIFYGTVQRAWRVRAAYPELLSSLVGYGLAMTFLSHTYTFFPYLLFAMVLAAGKVYARANAADLTDPEPR